MKPEVVESLMSVAVIVSLFTFRVVKKNAYEWHLKWEQKDRGFSDEEMQTYGSSFRKNASRWSWVIALAASGLWFWLPFSVWYLFLK